MRPIKFRWQRVDTKEWVYGDLLTAQWDIRIYDHETDSLPPVIPETVWQLTWLLDKNWKEIYEGDIVSSIAEKAHRDQNGDNVVYAKINEWKWGLWEIKSFINDGRSWHNGLDFDWGGWVQHEVIWNIYEHSNLLSK